MTIDETPRGPASGGESPGMGRSRSTARDIERYAGLFARRTQVMTSSAMRDLMAITARPEVISLAGGLPDTSAFPAEDVAALMARVAADSAAKALQYGPTEGMDEVKDCIVEVMAEEGMDADPEDLLVTTGGQQVIDLVCKALIDPGDVIVAEAPDLPGRRADVLQLPGRRRAGRDGRGRHADRRCSRRRWTGSPRRGGRRSSSTRCPSFQNPAGVTMALDRRRRLVRIAAERELLVLEDNPYGLLRYEGEAQPTLYGLDGGEYVIYLGTFSKILSPGLRLGWAAAPAARAAEAQPRQAGRRPVLVLVRAALRGRVLRPRRLARLHRPPARALPPPPRRDARGARGALPGRGDLDAPRGRALPVGHAARLHRHDGPARPRAARARGLRARPRGVPRRPRRARRCG